MRFTLFEPTPKSPPEEGILSPFLPQKHNFGKGCVIIHQFINCQFWDFNQ
jgi:hypothetical protein